jgi:hypothetical protein
MAYFVTEPRIGSQKIAGNSTTQEHALGERRKGYDASRGEGEFIYLKGVASTAVGEFVLYNEDDYSTSLLAANDVGQVAVAMAATVASEFGWYQIVGKASGKALSGFADNGNVYGTATGGSVDDAVVSGDRVKNCKGASAVSGGLADFEITFPHVDNGLAA